MSELDTKSRFEALEEIVRLLLVRLDRLESAIEAAAIEESKREKCVYVVGSNYCGGMVNTDRTLCDDPRKLCDHHKRMMTIDVWNIIFGKP